MEVGERDGARTAVATGRRAPGRRAAAPRAWCTAARPARRLADWNAARAGVRAARLDGVAGAVPRLDRLRTRVHAGAGGAVGRARRRRRRGRHPARREGGLGRHEPGRVDGRQRRRDDRPARRRPASRSRARGGRASSRCATCSTSPPPPTASSRATRCGWSARCRPPRRRTATARPLSRASEIRAPVLLLHGDRRRHGAGRHSRRSWPPRCGPAVCRVERHVYEGEGHGWRRADDDRRRVEAHRRLPLALGAAARAVVTGMS